MKDLDNMTHEEKEVYFRELYPRLFWGVDVLAKTMAVVVVYGLIGLSIWGLLDLMGVIS